MEPGPTPLVAALPALPEKLPVVTRMPAGVLGIAPFKTRPAPPVQAVGPATVVLPVQDNAVPTVGVVLTAAFVIVALKLKLSVAVAVVAAPGPTVREVAAPAL
jgi:hypothetical protein